MMSIKRVHIIIFSIFGILLLVSFPLTDVVNARFLDFASKNKRLSKTIGRDGKLLDHLSSKVKKFLHDKKLAINNATKFLDSYNDLIKRWMNKRHSLQKLFTQSYNNVPIKENISLNFISHFTGFLKSIYLLIILYLLMLSMVILSIIAPPIAFVVYCAKLLTCLYSKSLTNTSALLEKVIATIFLPFYIPMIVAWALHPLIIRLFVEIPRENRLIYDTTIIVLILPIIYIYLLVKLFDSFTGYVECIKPTLGATLNLTLPDIIGLAPITSVIGILGLLLQDIILVLTIPVTLIVYMGFAIRHIISIGNQTNLISFMKKVVKLMYMMPTYVVIVSLLSFLSFAALISSGQIVGSVPALIMFYVLALLLAWDGVERELDSTALEIGKEKNCWDTLNLVRPTLAVETTSKTTN